MATKKIIQRLTEHRWMLGIAVILFIIGTGRFLIDLGVDNSLEVWFVEDDPALVSYQAFLDEFGNDEVIVSALRSNLSAFEPARLERLKQLHDRLEEYPDVERVWSLANINVPEAGVEGVKLRPVLGPRVTHTQAALAKNLARKSRLASSLVGRDSTTLLVYTWLKASQNIDLERTAILERIRNAFDESLEGADEEALHAGLGVVYDALNQATFDEGAFFIGLSYLVVAVALFFITRRLLWTLLAIVVITLTDVALFGLMGWLERPLNMITMAIPALVMILGVANVVHMATSMDSVADRRRPFFIAALAAITVPCFFNALTTAGGFLSLTSASMAITRDYGLFSAIGVLIAFALSVAAMAIVVPLLPRLKPARGFRSGLAKIVERVLLVSYRNRWTVVAASLVLVGAAGWGISRIDIDTNSLDFLPAGHEFRRHSELIERDAGFYMPLEFTLLANDPSVWSNPSYLSRLHEAQLELEADPSFDRSTSLADVLQDLGALLRPASTPDFWNSVSAEELETMMAAFRKTADASMQRAFVSEDGRRIRLMTFVPMASARTFTALADRARGEIQAGMGPEVHVEVSGYLPLYGQMISHILTDQINSLALAFVVIFLLIALVLRSGLLSFVAIVLNALPVAVVLGFMGIAGIRLDIATVTIAAALLGIIVDDTVHMLYQLRDAARTRTNVEEALRTVARHSGLAIVSTSFVFCLGFGIIAFAGLKSVAYVGLLISIGVATALISDLVLMPAMMAFSEKNIPQEVQ